MFNMLCQGAKEAVEMALREEDNFSSWEYEEFEAEEEGEAEVQEQQEAKRTSEEEGKEGTPNKLKQFWVQPYNFGQV